MLQYSQKPAPKVLVAPLNWGLGHATRCIPLIRHLLAEGATVAIASEGKALKLLSLEFPQLKTLDLGGKELSYGNNQYFFLAMLTQFPKLVYNFLAEKKKIAHLQQQEKFDLIISDNRLGVRHSSASNVVISHQLHLIVPASLFFVKNINRYLLKKFDYCWIPDFAEENLSLSGKLSHPPLRKTTQNGSPFCHYLGSISRFERTDKAADEIDLLVVISGPEPQRSIFEKILLEQSNSFSGKIVLVRGLPDASTIPSNVPAHLHIKNHLKGSELSQYMQNAKVVISRSGYTTLMDAQALQCKQIIFVPTPGQSEQEYLGKYLAQQNIAPCFAQNDFDLATALREVKKYAGFAEQTYPKKDVLQQEVVDILRAVI
ncbi:MAG: glycosyltransferase [Chitinophagales bacterium]|nr:glycosyltransferase [Bacteroidota bacterium]